MWVRWSPLGLNMKCDLKYEMISVQVLHAICFFFSCRLGLGHGNTFYSMEMSILLHEPDETDNELRTVVIAMEFISQSGDHIFVILI